MEPVKEVCVNAHAGPGREEIALRWLLQRLSLRKKDKIFDK